MTGEHSGADANSDLFESFPDPLVAYSDGHETVEHGGDGRPTGETLIVTAINPAFEATFDIDASDVIGTSLDEFELAGGVGDEYHAGEPPDDQSTSVASTTTTLGSILDTLSGEAGARGRFHHRSGGETRHFHVREISAEPAVQHGYLLFTDVTGPESKRRDLATTVEQLERIASVASHDLRNPLEVAEIRLEAARDTGDEVHFEKIAAALDRIEQIVRDVLAVGGDSIEPTDAVSLAAVAEAAWDTVDTADATLHIPTGLPTVRADADRLQQLFENLFRNAVEHGSAGSRQSDSEQTAAHGSLPLTIKVEPVAGGFAVADDGSGIPEEAREHIFEAGYSTAEGNRGLGLSIVRRIAREHGWQISIASHEEADVHARGARFEFTGVTQIERDENDGDADSGENTH